MKNLSGNDALDTVLNTDFKEVDVTYRQLVVGGTVNVFFLTFKTEDALFSMWRKISNAIAVYFQSKITDEFAKWNTYLFYRTGFPVARELKYTIENDTFSSRKMIVQGNTDEDEIIKKHVVNDDLEIELKHGDNQVVVSFHKNKLIDDALKGKKVTGKTKYTPDAKEVLNEIEIALRKQRDAL